VKVPPMDMPLREVLTGIGSMDEAI
jgi:hypothetical protein